MSNRNREGISRRALLKWGGLLAAGSAMRLGLGRAWADAAWAPLPAGTWAGAPPVASKILEIFFYGGLSPWETFFHKPIDGPGWANAATEWKNVVWNPTGEWKANVPIGAEIEPFALDGGKQVYLGPATKPLWALKNKLRLVVLRHELLPHEAAIPYAITGHRIGRPRLAGTGAALQHRHEGALPSSYVLFAPLGHVSQGDNLTPIFAVGMHPGAARPLVLNADEGVDAFVQKLQRPAIASTQDELLRGYRGEYVGRLQTATGEQVRSRGVADYVSATDNLFNARAIKAALAGLPFAGPRMKPPAQLNSYPPLADAENAPRVAIKVAGQLLAGATPRARYVGVIDAGYVGAGGAGYDTHMMNTATTSCNLWNTLNALREEIDAGRIDLSTTLVVLNTEFGRTVSGGSGRDHWPQGYVVGLLGNPIPSAGIVGSIDVNGYGTTAYTPADVRAATLMAAHIDPFAPENFGVGDISRSLGAPTEPALRTGLRQTVLGI